MGKRQREWARRARLALIVELGAWCRLCRDTDINTLTIEHKQSVGWRKYHVDSSRRVSRYRREAKQGLLSVLCRSCNASTGQRFRTLKRDEAARLKRA